MTIQEMVNWFDIKQDKADSPYFTAAEKTQFINRAQNKFVNEYIYQYVFPSARMGQGSARVSSSIEATYSGSEVLQPLFITGVSLTSSASGIITDAAIKAAMNVISGDTTDFLYIMAVGKDLGGGSVIPVRYTRHNDFFQFQNNVFKQATASEPQYIESNGGLTFYPQEAADYVFNLIKYPIDVVFDNAVPANNVDSELPAFTHDDILAIALDDAGVASRDEALLLLKQASDQNLTSLA